MDQSDSKKERLPEENTESSNPSIPIPTTLSNTEELIRKVVENLDSQDDFYKLKFLCSPNIRYGIKKPEDLFIELKRNYDDHHFLHLVAQLLYTIQRYDLLKFGDWCRHNINLSLMNEKLINDTQKKRFEMIESLSRNDMDGIVKMFVELLKDSKKMTRQNLLESYKDLLGDDMVEIVEKRLIALEDLSYPMSASPCGVCAIINNEIFDKPKSLQDLVFPNRTGTARDRDKLKKLFEDFDFITEIHDNVTSIQMKKIIKELSERNFSNYNCVCVCILTHGEEGVVLGTDCKPINIQKDIVQQFYCDNKTKQSLMCIPKLFFIQACQGNSSMAAAREPIESDGPKHPAEQEEFDLIYSDGSHPAKSDDLLCLSTSEGFQSYRDKIKGTWFITCLVRNLRLFGTEKDILEVMRLVNKDVAEEEGTIPKSDVILKQMPIETNSLRRSFTFRWKEGIVKKPTLKNHI